MKEKYSGEKFFSKSFGKKFSSFLRQEKYSQHFILCDDNTNISCLPVLITEVPETAPAIVIKVYAGEENKNLQALEYVWKRLSEEHADRRAVLINLGGGMICDLGGFAAATYKRGIDFVHVPTSLLGQADAAVGGKQGIDFLNYKNQLGVFTLPAAIFVHESFLLTLPEEQMKSGFAEIVKHALIVGGKFWKEVRVISNLKEVNWSPLIEKSLEAKSAVVEKDPREKNLRKVLNFGHTIGHAIESFLLGKKEKTLHGFCVAAGMIGELYLSSIICGLSLKKRDEAFALIKKHFPRPGIAEDDFDEIIRLMEQDKKNSAGKIRMVLLRKPGEPEIDCNADEILIREALHYTLHFYEE